MYSFLHWCSSFISPQRVHLSSTCAALARLTEGPSFCVPSHLHYFRVHQAYRWHEKIKRSFYSGPVDGRVWPCRSLAPALDELCARKLQPAVAIESSFMCSFSNDWLINQREPMTLTRYGREREIIHLLGWVVAVVFLCHLESSQLVKYSPHTHPVTGVPVVHYESEWERLPFVFTLFSLPLECTQERYTSTHRCIYVLKRLLKSTLYTVYNEWITHIITVILHLLLREEKWKMFPQLFAETLRSLSLSPSYSSRSGDDHFLYSPLLQRPFDDHRCILIIPPVTWREGEGKKEHSFSLLLYRSPSACPMPVCIH